LKKTKKIIKVMLSGSELLASIFLEKNRQMHCLTHLNPNASEQLITEIRIIIVRNARMHACRIPVCRIQTVYQGRSTKARRRPHILQSAEFYYTFSRSNDELC